MLNSPTRRWIGGGVGACLLLAFVGWFFLIGPARAEASAHWGELATAEAQTAALRSRVNVLKTQFEGIEERRVALDVKRQSLPATNSLATLVLALNEAGAATGVTIDAVVPAEPIDLTPEPVVPPPDPNAEEADESEGAPVVVAPVVPSWQLFALPVTIQASGSAVALQNFLRVVQSEQPRAILITSFTLTPSEDLDGVQFTLTAATSVFVSPVTAIAPVVEAPAG